MKVARLLLQLLWVLCVLGIHSQISELSQGLRYPAHTAYCLRLCPPGDVCDLRYPYWPNFQGLTQGDQGRLPWYITQTDLLCLQFLGGCSSSREYLAPQSEVRAKLQSNHNCTFGQPSLLFILILGFISIDRYLPDRVISLCLLIASLSVFFYCLGARVLSLRL